LTILKFQLPVPIPSVEIFKSVPSEPFNSYYFPLNGPKENQLDMPIPPTSEKVMEADALLNKASLKVEEFRATLGQERYEMAQGWLEM
jgi:hypothetical protein